MRAFFIVSLCDFVKILHQDIKWCHCSENNCELVQNVRNTSSRAHIPSHICHCPFERPHYTFSNHWLWVVILYALNIMVPLLKWYLCFTRGNITTKSIDFQSAQVQTRCQGSNQVPHIWTRWSRTWLLWWLSRGKPSSSWLLRFWRGSGLPQWTPPYPSLKGDLLVILLWVPTPQAAYPCIWRGLLGDMFTLQSVISWLRSSTSWCSLWSARSPSSTWRWCGIPLLWGVCWGRCMWLSLPIWGV